PDCAVRLRAHLDVTATAADERQRAATDRYGESPDRLYRGLQLLRIADGHHHRIAFDAEPPVADAPVAQLAPHRILYADQPLLHDLRDIHLEQQVRSALQIEAQIDLIVRDPVGKLVEKVAAEEVGQAEQDAGGADGDDQVDLPAREIEHRQMGPTCGS